MRRSTPKGPAQGSSPKGPVQRSLAPRSPQKVSPRKGAGQRGASQTNASRTPLRFLPLCVFVLCCATPVFAALFRVWVNQDAVQSGYALSAEAAKGRKLQDRLEKLEVEWAAERSPARLSSLAARLGLTAPGPSNVFGGRPSGEARDGR